MAIALELGVFYLIAEFLAHTLVFGEFAYPARAISVLFFQTFFDKVDYLFIFVKPDFHKNPFPLSNIIVPNGGGLVNNIYKRNRANCFFLCGLDCIFSVLPLIICRLFQKKLAV